MAFFWLRSCSRTSKSKKLQKSRSKKRASLSRKPKIGEQINGNSVRTWLSDVGEQNQNSLSVINPGFYEPGLYYRTRAIDQPPVSYYPQHQQPRLGYSDEARRLFPHSQSMSHGQVFEQQFTSPIAGAAVLPLSTSHEWPRATRIVAPKLNHHHSKSGHSRSSKRNNNIQSIKSKPSKPVEIPDSSSTKKKKKKPQDKKKKLKEEKPKKSKPTTVISSSVKSKAKTRKGVTSPPSSAGATATIAAATLPSSMPTSTMNNGGGGGAVSMTPNGGATTAVTTTNPHTASMERVGWEYHTISLSRLPAYGFGIAISGGRDNPHFMNGDPSIAISDVLKNGPAEGKLMINDRIISANGVSLENVDYYQAIQVLRECVNTVNLLIKRRALLPPPLSDSVEVNNNPFKLTLTKVNKKDDFGIVIGCKFFIKEIRGKPSISEKDSMLVEGDIVHKINNTSLDGLSLKDVKKMIDGKEKSLSLMITRDIQTSPTPTQNLQSTPMNHSRLNHSQHLNNSSAMCTPPRFQPLPQQPEMMNGNKPPKGVENGDVSSLQQTPPQAPEVPSHGVSPPRPQNGYSKQNLYVQSPVRNSSQHQRQSSSVQDVHDVQEHPNHTSTPVHPPVATLDDEPKSELSSLEMVPSTPGTVSPNGEIRTIAFIKEGSVGIRLTGGNEVGIFVTAVQPGSPAAAQGLKVGDKILSANGTQMLGHTREEAVLFLLKIQDRIELVVQNCPQEYESILANQKGDSFHVRTHFNFDSEGKGELSFHTADVFHVVDTLFNGVVGSWFVYRLGRNNQEIQKGSIPNRSRAEELAIESRSKSKAGNDDSLKDSTSKRAGFFKRRRSARRSKSFSKDHWEDLVFGDAASKCPAYERVQLKNPGFVRPLVFFGPLADIVREKLLRDYPQRFASPQALTPNGTGDDEDAKKSGIVRLSAIKDVIESGKHALLDITPAAVDRLNYAQFYPIVIFMRTESKSVVKELRSRSSSKVTVRRSSRKLFEQSLKLEKNWYHIFTSSVTLTTGGDTWYKNITEIIEKQQSSMIWMAESAPPPSAESEILFPMLSSRMSYAASSGAESDADFDAPNDDSTRLDDEDEDPRKFVSQPNLMPSRLNRASSDPNMNQPDSSMDASIISKPQESPKESPEKKSPNKVPLHILLRKELAKALHTHESRKSEAAEASQTAQQQVKAEVSPPDVPADVFNYPTLRVQDKFPETQNSGNSLPTAPTTTANTSPITNGVVSATPVTIVPDSPLPPPPPTSLPPAMTPPPSENPLSMLVAPPRVDRGSKPNRFRSAHERLFGPKSSHSTVDESDYINTADLPDYEAQMRLMRSTTSANNLVPEHSRQMESNSSFSSDSFKYKPRNGPIPPPLNIPGSTRHSSIDNTSKSLPPLPTEPMNKPVTEVLQQRATPPSPPPKPKSVNNLQYQMNSMSLNDRPPPPPKMAPNGMMNNGYDPQSDYDNIPPVRSLSRNPSFATSTAPPPPPPMADAMNAMNSPYYPHIVPSYPSRPTSQYATNSGEIIANFINPHDQAPHHFQYPPINRSRPPSQYYEMPPYETQPDYSNYDSVRASTGYPQYPPPPPHAPNNGYQSDQLYLNVPFKGYNGSGSYSRATNLSESSPLPPPPPLPAHHYAPQMPGLVQPTPQPAANSQGFIDLTRERVSAFEPYRKPQHSVAANEMFQGLPPPPPPLMVNDYNCEYTNLEHHGVVINGNADRNNNPYQADQATYMPVQRRELTTFVQRQEVAQLVNAPDVPKFVQRSDSFMRVARF